MNGEGIIEESLLISYAFRDFVDALRLEQTHLLYPTQYGLCLPIRRRRVLGDCIDEIITEAAARPSVIRRLSLRDFERFLCRIFERFGYEVELTSATRDGGVDH